jgi:hypothetical protein
MLQVERRFECRSFSFSSHRSPPIVGTQVIEHAQREGLPTARPMTVFLIVLAWAVPLGAQTAAQFPKTTGVGNAVVQRAMTNLHPLSTFRVGGNPDWIAECSRSIR